jgi:hypothetical protein
VWQTSSADSPRMRRRMCDDSKNNALHCCAEAIASFFHWQWTVHCLDCQKERPQKMLSSWYNISYQNFCQTKCTWQRKKNRNLRSLPSSSHCLALNKLWWLNDWLSMIMLAEAVIFWTWHRC